MSLTFGQPAIIKRILKYYVPEGDWWCDTDTDDKLGYSHMKSMATKRSKEDTLVYRIFEYG